MGIASWLFSFHHAAWLWIAATASSIWSALIFPVPVPVSVVVIFAATFLYLLRRDRRLPVVATATGDRSPSIVGPLVAADSFEEQDEPARPAPLTDNEIEIVRVLAKADGRRMTKEGLARAAGLSNLFAEQAIDRLSDHNFLHQVATLDRVVYRLSPEGRDYAIAAGYVGNPTAQVARFPF